MRDPQTIAVYLDELAELLRLLRPRSIVEMVEQEERINSGRAGELWQACMADGWTVADIDAAYKARFERQNERGASDGN